MGAADRLGQAAGWLLAPLMGGVSLLRRARMFHPEGAVYRAEIVPLPGPFPALGRRLAGPALARFSTALWRGGSEWMDALGIALRLGQSPAVVPRPGDQDLLFATIKHPWTMPFAPLTTEQHDFLANDYFAVAPFQIGGVGRGKLRLVASRPRRLQAPGRGERLDEAVGRGEASLRLEVQTSGHWQAVAEVRIVERAEIDQEALRFSPFRDGKGLTPRGFVHGLRQATYLLSQLARPAAAR